MKFVASLLRFLLFAVAVLSKDACTTPSVRNEWRSLSPSSRAEWINATKCLSKIPHNSSVMATVYPAHLPQLNPAGSLYDDIVYLHLDLNNITYTEGLLLPWHRWLINSYETALKEKCGFTGASPYWDLTQDADDFFASTIFDEDSVENGLGGWGDPLNDFQVSTGAFTKDFIISYPVAHTLRRNFTLQPYLTQPTVYANPELKANETFTAAEVKRMVTGYTGDFAPFSAYLSDVQGIRGAIHLILGGDSAGMCPIEAGPNCVETVTWGPNEPLFWLYHAMIDKVWYDWQNYNTSANFWSFEAENYTLDSMLPNDGLFEKATIRDVVDTKGGFLCYVYE